MTHSPNAFDRRLERLARRALRLPSASADTLLGVTHQQARAVLARLQP